MQNTPLKVVVLGPTATGKTALGVALAKALQTDVISFDSQLVWSGVGEIGVAKPTEAERQGVVHHLMDCGPHPALLGRHLPAKPPSRWPASKPSNGLRGAGWRHRITCVPSSTPAMCLCPH
ncbi:MAG: hypothetical protein R2857_13940 [Vampirovibrionales bacterium]